MNLMRLPLVGVTPNLTINNKVIPIVIICDVNELGYGCGDSHYHFEVIDQTSGYIVNDR